MSPSRRFLILHGWENHRPQHHWQWWLAEQLRSAGEQVLYPQLPSADFPRLSDWTELLHAELAQLGDGERVVIAHSLGAALWLNAAPELGDAEHVDRVLLVSPPSPRWLQQYPSVEAFALEGPDQEAIAAAAGTTRLVYSNNDPCCEEGATTVLAPLALDADLITDGGHINPDSGYGPWPSMLEWCLSPWSRLTAR